MESNNKGKSSFAIIGCVLIAAVVVFCCFIFMIIMVIAGQSGAYTQGYSKTTYIEGTSGSEVYVIDVSGVIISADDGIYEINLVDYVLNSLDEAIKEDKVKVVIMRLNTPGGSVYDSALITDKMNQLKGQGKKIIAVIEEMAASGGYWVASQADYIFIHPQSITGSIGVVWEFVDHKELYNKIGLKEVAITNSQGTNKRPTDLDNPESDGRRVFQVLADESFESFLKMVTEGRKLTRDQVLPYADGRILSAKQAMDAKFVDEYGGYAQAIQYIKDEKIIDDPKVVELHRTQVVGWDSLQSKINVLYGQINNTTRSAGVYALPEYYFDENS